MNVFSVFGKKDANNIFDIEKLWFVNGGVNMKRVAV
jgi:hypothetical protein